MTSLALLCLVYALPVQAANPMVRMTTNQGVVELELFADQAPLSVKNFLDYAASGFYDGTVFHRVIPGFMIQGGGFTAGMRQKDTRAPIRNEADNGLKNTYGTLAMARTMEPHSATAQFFVNTADNAFLDHSGKSQRGWGYAVFGRVTQGMAVVEKIARLATKTVGPHENVPVADVVIGKIELLSSAAAK